MISATRVSNIPCQALYALLFLFVTIDVFYGLRGAYQNGAVDAVETVFAGLMVVHHWLKTL